MFWSASSGTCFAAPPPSSSSSHHPGCSLSTLSATTASNTCEGCKEGPHVGFNPLPDVNIDVVFLFFSTKCAVLRALSRSLCEIRTDLEHVCTTCAEKPENSPLLADKARARKTGKVFRGWGETGGTVEKGWTPDAKNKRRGIFPPLKLLFYAWSSPFFSL